MLQKIVSFEGIDGSGKTTCLEYLADILRKAKFVVNCPRYERWETESKVDVKSLSEDSQFFLHLAGTIEEETKFVQKEYKNYDFTLLDRGLDTNVVYSMLFTKLVRPRRFYDEINKVFREFSREPDLSFLIEATVDEALDRIIQRNFTLSKNEFYEKREYLVKLQEFYAEYVEFDTFGVVSPRWRKVRNQNPETATAEIKMHVQKKFRITL